MFHHNRDRPINSIFSPFQEIAKIISGNRSLRLSLIFALFVWTVWLIILRPGYALNNLINNWEVATTMIFGSIVAGGTSMGGGAVAFPVLTKVLEVPPHEAKVFSLAIQSIGMGAASLTIVTMGTPVEWRFIRWAGLGSIPGMIVGALWLAPIFPPEFIKLSFTMMVSSFALILLALNRSDRGRNMTITSWGRREKLFAVVVGVVGGIISSLVGSGLDIFAFSVMVLLFGLCEKVCTPSSVILMAFNAWTGFVLHKYVLGGFIEPVHNYWLAAVPIVVVGAPTGAMLCDLLPRSTIVKILLGLISIEVFTSLVLIPLNPTLISFSLFVFVLFSLIYYWMYQSSKRNLIVNLNPNYLKPSQKKIIK